MTVKLPKKPAKCGLYIAGHCTHPIQARKASENGSTTATLVAIDDGVVTIEHSGRIGRFRNHEVEQLVEIAPIGTTLRLYEAFRILGVDMDRGSWKPFYVADDDDPWTPCDTTPITSSTPEALAERLQTHGGFLLPGYRIAGESGGDE